MFNKFLNLIYNKKCLICANTKTDELLCKNCLKDVQFLSSFAHRIYKEIPIYSALVYDSAVKKLIHKLKFQHKKSASIPLAKLLFEYFNKLDLSNDFIICYPSGYYLRTLSRGYNPVFLIVKEFSKIAQIDYIKDLIIKTKYTKPQYKAKNKVKNIKGSFKIDKNKLKKLENKTILLIDDITTSGATINELIDTLKDFKINDIICLTLAKAVK